MAKRSTPDIKLATSPTKDNMLQMLEDLKSRINNGEILSLLCVPIKAGHAYDIMFDGDIDTPRLVGLLTIAAIEAAGNMWPPMTTEYHA